MTDNAIYVKYSQQSNVLFEHCTKQDENILYTTNLSHDIVRFGCNFTKQKWLLELLPLGNT